LVNGADNRIVNGIRSITKKKVIYKRLDNHDLVEIEYDNPETVTEAMKAIDKIFLLTPTHPKMLEFTSNLVNEAIERRVKHIVKISHIRADPDDMSPKSISLVYIVKKKKL
jgi:uncharacterized protein YbjT (DUF2867 family)